MSIRYAKDQEGNRVTYRSAVDSEGNQSWHRVSDDGAGGGDRQSADIIKATKEFEANTPEGLAIAKGPEAVARLEKAKAMPWYEKFAKGAVNESVKLGAGTADLLDTGLGMSYSPPILDGVFSINPGAMLVSGLLSGGSNLNITDMSKSNAKTGINEKSKKYFYPRQFMSAPMRQMDRAERMRKMDLENAEFDSVSGAWGFLGTMAPYVIGEATLGPKTAAYANKFVNKLGNKIVSSTKTGGGYIERGVKALEKSPLSSLHTTGKYIKEHSVDPIKKYAGKLAERNVWTDLDTVGRTKDILGGTLSGITMGAAHYDNSAIEGGITGFGGSIAGSTLRPYLSRKANYNNPAAKETIEQMELRGYRVSPGVKYKREHLQDIEAGLRKDAHSRKYIGAYDDANQRINNKIAYQTMGIPKEKAANMTPSEFKVHLDKISSDYDKLVSSTKGTFTKDKYKALSSMIDDMDTIYHSDVKVEDAARRYLMDLKDKTKVTRNTGTGRFQKATFNGKDYQRIRRRVKNDLDKAYKDGDMNAVDIFKPILDTMDDALEEGIELGGDVSAKAWKELNEKNAMSEYLIRNALDTKGDVDTQRLLSSFQGKNGDMKRLLTGQGGKIKDLHLLAGMRQLENKASVNTGIMGAKDREGNTTMLQKLIFNRIGESIPGPQKMYMKAYMEGIPSLHGLLMNRYDGFYKPSTFTRSAAQASQVHPLLVNSIMDGAETVGEYGNKVNDLLEDN